MLFGSIVALVTPFNEWGKVDFTALEGLIQWQIEEGTDGLVLCGSTGEGSSLTFEEKVAIFQRASELGKRKIRLIANTGTNQTIESIELTQEAKKLGFDACLTIVPYYARPTEEGCFRHFAEIGKVGLPMIFYHHPARTGLALSADIIERIYSIPQVIGIKEASGDFNLATRLMRKKVPFFSGNDDLALPYFSLGAAGTISIIGNVIPKQWKGFVSLALKGEWGAAREQFFEFYSLCKALVLETNPQCVKYAVSQLGKCSARMRLPLLEPTIANQEKIIEALPAALDIR